MMADSNATLKGCPLCGEQPVALETHPGYGELYCGNCDLVLGGNNAMTPEELTERWNRRTATDDEKVDAATNVISAIRRHFDG